MLRDGHEVKDIASTISRKTKTVQDYVDNELDALHGTIINSKIDQATRAAQETQKTPEIPETAAEQVERIERARKEDLKKELNEILKDHGVEIDPPKEEPKSHRQPKNQQFLNKTAGGKKVISLNNAAASAVSDFYVGHYPKQELSRTARGNVYNIDEDTVKE